MWISQLVFSVKLCGNGESRAACFLSVLGNPSLRKHFEKAADKKRQSLSLHCSCIGALESSSYKKGQRIISPDFFFLVYYSFCVKKQY